MTSGVRIILVTQTGCGHCAQFLAGPWTTLKDQLSYAIGGGSVEAVDNAKNPEKIPSVIRRQLKFVPQIYALYPDGTVETPRNAITTGAGLKELQQWTKEGPPRYAATKSDESEEDIDELSNPRLEVVALTATTCGHCQMWEVSGELQKFLESLPASVDKSHYVIPDRPPTSPDDTRRRMSVVGIRVPSVVVTKRAKWMQPVSQQLGSKDILLSPFEVREVNGAILFKRWLSMLQDQKTPFSGYMLLATSASCGHCIAWKQSGGMDQFVANNKNIPGIILVHNGRMPDVIASSIRAVPSVWFVPANQWSSPNPEVMPGPDPRNSDAIKAWVAQLTSSEGSWKNDKNYLPDDYAQAAAMREPRPASALPVRRSLRRQIAR